jgi:cytochrome c-type biogenesis protein CcmH/NrfG
VSLALVLGWALATGRTFALHWPRRGALAPRAPPHAERSAERIGLLTLLSIALIFGMHSLIDWTWFVPGTAIAGLACAGWLVGRGPLAKPVGRLAQRRRLSRSPGATFVVASVAAIAILAIWVTLQPLRSSDAYWSAFTALTHGNAGAALTDARTAAAENPVSIDPLFLLSRIYTSAGNGGAARRELVKATSLQPSNPQTWQQLGCYDLGQHRPQAAGSELGRAFVLEPGQAQIRTDPGAFCATVTL